MSDTIKILNARREKADIKASRYRKMLKTAEKELTDIDTALRVLGEIEGESADSIQNVKAAPTVNRQLEIVGLLGIGKSNARSPINLFEHYQHSGKDDISIDTFRTTIWRMRDKVYDISGNEWIVGSAEGNYWKDQNVTKTFPTAIDNPPPWVQTVKTAEQVPVGWSDDLEDDVPF